MDILPKIYSAFPYYGGKYYAVKELAKLVPDHIVDLKSPFIGGASLEVNLAHSGTRVAANDDFRPVANFWQTICGLEGFELVRAIKYTIPNNKDEWLQLKKEFDEEATGVEAAANFYNIIQHSFAGTGMAQSGYFHRPRKDYQACADKLDALIGLPLYCCDFDFVDFMKARDSKADPDKSLVFADPPYDKTENNYGRKRGVGIDHSVLRELLERHKYWILTIDPTDRIRELYSGCHFARLPRYRALQSLRHHTHNPPVDVAVVSEAVATSRPRIYPLERFK